MGVKPDNRISGFLNQLDIDDDQSAKRQDKESVKGMQTCIECDQSIRTTVGSTDWPVIVNDPRDSPSTTTLQSPPEIPPSGSEDGRVRPRVGIEYCGESRSLMVDRQSQTQQWSTNDDPCGTNDNNIRCLENGVGGSMQLTEHRWSLDVTRENGPHQHTRTESCIPSLKDLCSRENQISTFFSG